MHHAEQLLLFVKDTDIPESSGWPFGPVIKFAAIHESIHPYIVEAAKQRGAEIVYDTLWGQWSINLSTLFPASTSTPSSPAEQENIPTGWRTSKVPEDNLDIVIENSSIKRHKDTLKQLESRCLINEKGEMVAWAFVGIDGSLCSMFVVEEFRGRGLARIVARVLLRAYYKGQKEGGSGWVHAEVGEGNVASECVMKALGAVKSFRTGYAGIDVSTMR